MSELLQIDRVACVTQPGEKPIYSPYGYNIAADGTVYALIHHAVHGIILAILYPEKAVAAGYAVPTEPWDELNVFEYQRFELDNAPSIDMIRISIGQLSGSINFSKGNSPATPAQINAVMACAKELGVSYRDKIETDFGERTLTEIIEALYVQEEHLVKVKDDTGW